MYLNIYNAYPFMSIGYVLTSAWIIIFEEICQCNPVNSYSHHRCTIEGMHQEHFLSLSKLQANTE